MGPDPSSTGEYSTLDAMPDTSSRAPAPSLPLLPVAPLPPGSAVTAAKPIFGDGKPSTRHGARAKGTLTPWPPPHVLPARRLAPGHAPLLLPVPRPRAADPRPPGVRTVQNPRPPTGGRPPGAAAVACFLLLSQLSFSVSVLRHRPPPPLPPSLERHALQGAFHLLLGAYPAPFAAAPASADRSWKTWNSAKRDCTTTHGRAPHGQPHVEDLECGRLTGRLFPRHG